MLENAAIIPSLPTFAADVVLESKVTTKNTYINVEGIFLPVVNPQSTTTTNMEEPYLVPSTRANLRSLAIAVSSNRSVCLSGPVGCGKTMLVEYLARKTGRLLNFYDEIDENECVTNIEETPAKRKLQAPKKSIVDDGMLSSFLRVQLGDQTDGKTLLGQYR